ncbi:hypothetical protein Pelo_1433 [Pelomyxa schiedti]|nr:hypothetical protein Pelo_1433 [Pelomyxa schiedti]
MVCGSIRYVAGGTLAPGMIAGITTGLGLGSFSDSPKEDSVGINLITVSACCAAAHAPVLVVVVVRVPVLISAETPRKYCLSWQVAALLMSSHPRCGAHSPARIMSASAPLMSHFWSEIVLAGASAFVLYLESADFTDDSTPSTVHIGLSRRLLGVTYLQGIDLLHRVKCVAPEQVLVPDGNGYALRSLDLQISSRNECRDLGNQAQPFVCTFAESERSPFFAAANSMWLLNARSPAPGSDHETVMIWELPQCPQEKPVEPLEFRIPGSDILHSLAGVFLSKTVPDEAVVAARNHSHIVLTLFDVRKTVQSKKLAVLASTGMLPLSGHRLTFGVVLVMRRKTFDMVFIAQTFLCEVFAIDPRTGGIRQITEKEEHSYSEPNNLTQVSSSVFCIWHEKYRSYELWDCNNIDQPLRAINPDDNFDQVVAGSGFLFVVVKHSVTVIEPFAGCLVAAFSLAMPALIHPQDSVL